MAIKLKGKEKYSSLFKNKLSTKAKTGANNLKNKKERKNIAANENKFD